MAHVHLCDDEQKLIDDWLKRHDAACRLAEKSPFGIAAGTLGERLTYSVTPCSLGNLTIISCGCGAALELPIEDGGSLIGQSKETDAP